MPCARATCDGGRHDGLGRSPVLQPVERAGLGDVPVLAELAGQVAAGGAERQHRRAWQVVVERLLLDRIEAEPGGPPVGGQHDLVVLATAHEAQPALALVELAQPRAHIALNAAIPEPMPIAAGNALQALGFDHGQDHTQGSREASRDLSIGQHGQHNNSHALVKPVVFRRAEIRTRPPAVAGAFYPAASAKLEKTVADLLAAVPATGGREPAGIIVPHAGYVYSAVTAAHAFARVAGPSGRWQRAVIIGPAHYVRFSGVA